LSGKKDDLLLSADTPELHGEWLEKISSSIETVRQKLEGDDGPTHVSPKTGPDPSTPGGMNIQRLSSNRTLKLTKIMGV